MGHEIFPHSPHSWLRYMKDSGTSNRPYPTERSDLFEAQDPLGIKAERSALAAIISTRVYQRAKRMLLGQRHFLSQPSSHGMIHPALLEPKAEGIGKAFKAAIASSLLREERYLKSLSSDDPRAAIYQRLHDILSPFDEMINPRDAEIVTTTGSVVENPSVVFREVYIGAEAFPANMVSLFLIAYRDYYEQRRKDPSVDDVLRIMGNSYETYIKQGASVHREDADEFANLELGPKKTVSALAHLSGDGIEFRQEVLDDALARQRSAQEDEGSRSITARCAFLTPGKNVAPFLDTPPDFEDPLKDSFNLYMSLLSA